MKKIFFYLISLVLIIISCNNSGTNKTSNSIIGSIKSIDTLETESKQEQSVLQKIIHHSNLIKRDTTVKNCHISYIIQDNDEVITTYPVTDGKGLDTVYYAGREIILDIKYSNGEFLNKKINKAFFASYIPNKEMQKYSISYFNLDNVDNNERIVFSISLCIPETDICYWFELYVASKENIKIENVTSDEEDDM